MNLLKTRKIVLIALIPVLLVIYILQLAAAGKNTVKYLTMNEEPDELVIVKADGQEIRLTEADGSWLVGDRGYPADNNTAGSLATGLNSIKVLETVSSSGADLSRYGLDDSTAVTVRLLKDGRLIRTVRIGKASSTARQTYISVDGSKDILLASGTFSTDYAKTLDELRSREIFNLDTARISSVTAWTPDGGETMLAKNPDDGTWLNDPDTKIASWITGIASLTAQSWAPEDIELTETAGRVSIATTTGKVTVTVYQTDDSSRYLATSSETPYPFYLSSYTAERYIRTAEDFQ